MTEKKETYGAGHRSRLRDRFAETDGEGMPDYEKLELLLFHSIPRQDTKPLARELLKRFGSLPEVLTSPAEELRKVPGLGEASAVLFRLVRRLALDMSRTRVSNRLLLDSIPDILEYARLRIGSERKEMFMVIYLNIRDEVIGSNVIAAGTVDQLTLYPRELFAEALAKNSSGIILIHNHPGGSLEPSMEDLRLTDELEQLGKQLRIILIDHLIVTSSAVYSILGRLYGADSPADPIPEAAAGEKNSLRKGSKALPFHTDKLKKLRNFVRAASLTVSEPERKKRKKS